MSACTCLCDGGSLNLLPALPTSMQQPFTDSLCDIKGQPLRGAPGHHVPATEIALLCNVLISLQDLHQEKKKTKETIQSGKTSNCVLPDLEQAKACYKNIWILALPICCILTHPL